MSELYCHPAERAPTPRAPHQPEYDSVGELAALTSPRVRAALRTAAVELVSYPQL